MGRTGSRFDDRRRVARNGVLAVVVFAVLAAVMTYSAVLLGVSRRAALMPVLGVGSVFAAGEILKYLIARFSLPDAVFPLVAGVGLLVFCVWLIIAGGSLVLIAVAALAGSWFTYDAFGSLRATGSATTDN